MQKRLKFQISPNTVMRDWSTAKAWLHRELCGQSTRQKDYEA
jgi:hypothetical protein